MKKLLSSEVFKYLFFGVLATLVYMGTRLVIFALTQSATTSAVIANVIAIMFAFFTNDYFSLIKFEQDGLTVLSNFL